MKRTLRNLFARRFGPLLKTSKVPMKNPWTIPRRVMMAMTSKIHR